MIQAVSAPMPLRYGGGAVNMLCTHAGDGQEDQRQAENEPRRSTQHTEAGTHAGRGSLMAGLYMSPQGVPR